MAAFFFNTLVTFSASAQGSAYAVFKVSYSEAKGGAVGGVAGTAFFLSTKRASTAYHVLNPQSFIPAPGYTHTRVWLVHEGEKAIELKPTNVTYHADRDQTEIHFDHKVVAAQFVFKKSKAVPVSGEVESEGFPANSLGPQLTWVGQKIEITSVPHLERIKMKGTLLRQTKVSVKATDVNLDQTPSLQLSYKPVVGTSGGPVTMNGALVGFNSFADPNGRQTTWAVEL